VRSQNRRSTTPVRPPPLMARQRAISRRGGGFGPDDWISNKTKRRAHRDCDFLLFLARLGSAGAAATATFSSAFFTSGGRGLGAEESGAFFRRTFTPDASADESEFLLPVTSSLKDGTELSLLRLFRPLHGHGDFCGGGELPVLPAMVSVVQHSPRSWRGATMRSAAGYFRAGNRRLSGSSLGCVWVFVMPVRNQDFSSRCRMNVDGQVCRRPSGVKSDFRVLGQPHSLPSAFVLDLDLCRPPSVFV
jgi:hypothetical protein